MRCAWILILAMKKNIIKHSTHWRVKIDGNHFCSSSLNIQQQKPWSKLEGKNIINYSFVLRSKSVREIRTHPSQSEEDDGVWHWPWLCNLAVCVWHHFSTVNNWHAGKHQVDMKPPLGWLAAMFGGIKRREGKRRHGEHEGQCHRIVSECH